MRRRDYHDELTTLMREIEAKMDEADRLPAPSKALRDEIADLRKRINQVYREWDQMAEAWMQKIDKQFRAEFKKRSLPMPETDENPGRQEGS